VPQTRIESRLLTDVGKHSRNGVFGNALLAQLVGDRLRDFRPALDAMFFRPATWVTAAVPGLQIAEVVANVMKQVR
jgi:hypothetical protein